MDLSKLQREHPAAWAVRALLVSDGALDAMIPTTCLQVLDWTPSKVVRALDRLQALGMIQSVTTGNRRRVLVLPEELTATDKLRAVEAKGERWRPVRVEGAELVMSDGSTWPLPEDMRDPAMYDHWSQFAVLMDKKLERLNMNFMPEEYFRQMDKIITAGKKTNSYNICYVYDAYAEYIKTSKYNIVIANKVADKAVTKQEQKAPEMLPEVTPKSGARPNTREGLRDLAGIIQSALMDGGLTMPEAEKLVAKNWEIWDNALARVKGGYPTEKEIRESVSYMAKDKRTGTTPAKVANHINNGRNPDLFKKKEPMKTDAKDPEEKRLAEIEDAYNIAASDPAFVRRIEAQVIKKWPDFNKMNTMQQRHLMFGEFNRELVEAGV